MTHRIVLLVGLPASGKDLAASIIRDMLGYEVVTMSDVLKEELRRRGMAVNRENMRRVGTELRRTMGMGVVAKRVIERIERLGDRVPGVVVNGIRNVEEVDEFRSKYGDEVVLIAVLADRKTRYERQLRRKREGFDVFSWEKFLREEREEILSFHLGDAIAMADHFVLNEGTEEDLRRSLVRILSSRTST